MVPSKKPAATGRRTKATANIQAESTDDDGSSKASNKNGTGKTKQTTALHSSDDATEQLGQLSLYKKEPKLRAAGQSKPVKKSVAKPARQASRKQQPADDSPPDESLDVDKASDDQSGIGSGDDVVAKQAEASPLSQQTGGKMQPGEGGTQSTKGKRGAIKSTRESSNVLAAGNSKGRTSKASSNDGKPPSRQNSRKQEQTDNQRDEPESNNTPDDAAQPDEVSPLPPPRRTVDNKTQPGEGGEQPKERRGAKPAIRSDVSAAGGSEGRTSNPSRQDKRKKQQADSQSEEDSDLNTASDDMESSTTQSNDDRTEDTPSPSSPVGTSGKSGGSKAKQAAADKSEKGKAVQKKDAALKGRRGNDAENGNPNENDAGDGVEESDNDPDKEFEVEKIVGVRTRKQQIEYCVKWVGYDEKDNSWEPRHNLNCDYLIEKFEAETTAANSRSGVSSRASRAGSRK